MSSQEANRKVNELYNTVREALKADDGKKHADGVAEILTQLANVGETAVTKHRDPGFALGTYFAGFSAIALMIGAMPEDTPAEVQMQFVRTVIALATNAIVQQDKGDN